jgi:hypothetical protein
MLLNIPFVFYIMSMEEEQEWVEIRHIIVDKPQGHYMLDNIHKMVQTVFGWNIHKTFLRG